MLRQRIVQCVRPARICVACHAHLHVRHRSRQRAEFEQGRHRLRADGGLIRPKAHVRLQLVCELECLIELRAARLRLGERAIELGHTLREPSPLGFGLAQIRGERRAGRRLLVIAVAEPCSGGGADDRTDGACGRRTDGEPRRHTDVFLLGGSLLLRHLILRVCRQCRHACGCQRECECGDAPPGCLSAHRSCPLVYLDESGTRRSGVPTSSARSHACSGDGNASAR